MLGLPHQPAGNMSPTPSTPVVAMEAREGRIGNAFACERCRKHKVRCVPSDTNGICQRCQKARVECIEHVARRRPAKPRTVVQTPTRVSEIEKRIDKMSAIVTTASAPSSAPQPTLPPVISVPSQHAESGQRTPTPASKTPILPNPGSTPESALSFWESLNDTISGIGRLDPVIRSISVIHMQLLLETYRTMVDFFPFVTLPKDCFCRDFIQQRPMLMFAVLTAASYDSALLQLTLSREFRKVIMVKIMNGEKSLDLLQGLLVFIAWHHHYMDAQAISINLLLQMCVGIAGDLGLDNLPPPGKSLLQRDDPREREAKRAYLGCYYLASNLGLPDTGRVRSVSYSITHRTYASELASAWEHRSDAILPILINTCQFTEDIEETFRDLAGQALVAKAQLLRLSEKWDQMRIASKAQANDYKTLQCIQLAAQVYLHKMAASLELLDREITSRASGFQLTQRIACLRSIEQYLDNALQLSATNFEFLSIVDWLNLASSLTTLGKFALHTPPIPGWDPIELQIAKTFEYFRDQLCSQMPHSRDPQDNNEDLFERFRRITAVMKMAVKSAPGRGSPNGSTFELATGSGRTVSLLQELPPLKPNGTINGSDPLPAPWKIHPQFDMSSNEFLWKFLMGTV
ncbi:hypothetical protein K458DRAFT_447526 [Lentithecium fluviatile CBS 122367]|uniref:Zn(2)-C6 fungal-type domain-containing protein n=1 Tax=Lentithecium fluviatile CBS 122367 TaxID=1168545 RepID=A0A6G1IEM6_9PLEO|nr:hypothetical protein K458DRAFT_447526 [Lentithecium fluviatile CBS 122367]